MATTKIKASQIEGVYTKEEVDSLVGSGGGLEIELYDSASSYYYYYGGSNLSGWVINRFAKNNLTKSKAIQSGNSYSDLSSAWANRETLNYV